MNSEDKLMISHLLRRAGFGTTPKELERYISLGYENTVEELLNPKHPENMSDDIIFRMFPEYHASIGPDAPAIWAYRMVTTQCPLQEKLALFWHGVFATACDKLNYPLIGLNQVEMFRQSGFGKFDDLLVELSKDPAMIIFLDNQTNHKDAINENYGREILELFSMGVGNYSEDDIKECARAFTGWTIANADYMELMSQKDSIWPYSRIAWHFEFRKDDHDDGVKTFLGKTGRFNGNDIVEIICREDATARFVARHLYNFFVADEVPVPQWNITSPKDLGAIDELVDAYMKNDHDIRSMLRVLFNSEFFKKAQFAKIKSPIELVIGTLRATGECRIPSIDMVRAVEEANYMGQSIMYPPSVEGWHTGEEWITSGSLVNRVNFASDHLSNLENPGVENIVNHILGAPDDSITAERLVDKCLDTLGHLKVSKRTKESLLEVATKIDSIESNGHSKKQKIKELIPELIRMIVSSREYQFV
jgi:uncharacterized protein (DUF1800 family)